MKKADIEREAMRYAAALLQQCDVPLCAGIDNTRDAAIFQNKLKTMGNVLARRAARPGEEYTIANLNQMAWAPPEPI